MVEKRETQEERRRRRRAEEATREKAAGAAFRATRNAETSYRAQLRKLAEQVNRIIAAFLPGDPNVHPDPAQLIRLRHALDAYAVAIEPWARETAWRMLREVNRRDATAWREYAERMGLGIRAELATGPSGDLYRDLISVQVGLIQSLPREAAQHVQERAMEALSTSTRFPEREAEIREQLRAAHFPEEWIRHRATLIARTETARAASVLTQARAENLGSTQYIWRTSRDWKVRPSHKKLDGSTQRWDAPPLSDPPDYHSHPGQIWNCLTGETIVNLSTGCRRFWRIPYQGPLICLDIAGQLIRITPNHPILTPHGFVAAGTLNEGDDVTAVTPQQIGVVKADDNQMSATFEQIFTACVAAGLGELVPSLDFNFHGDAANGDVDEIRTDLLLSDDAIASIFEHLCNAALCDANSGGNAVRASRLLQILEALTPGVSGKLRSFMLTKRLHANRASRSTITTLDAMFTQNSTDSQTGDAILACQSELAHSIPVGGDDIGFGKRDAVGCPTPTSLIPGLHTTGAQSSTKVVGIAADLGSAFPQGLPVFVKRLRVRKKVASDFAGHVYTLQSDTGWYSITAAGIATKNCRCIALPIL